MERADASMRSNRTSSVFSPRSSNQAVSAEAIEPGQAAGEVEAVEERVVLHRGDAGDQVVVPREHLGGAVQRHVAAMLERAQPERRGERRVAHD